MSLRRFAVPSLALAVLACQASIPSQSPPETIAFAVSFPDSSDGTQAFQPPIPNDLVLQAATSASPPTVSAAQLALLKAFATAGGFPNDQEVPIQIQFFAVKPDAAGGNPTAAPFPDLDTTTITTSTLAVVRVDTGTPTPVEFEVAPTDYSATTGVLTIHKKVDPATGARWWAAGPGGGRYVVALRAGDKGVKTKAGKPIAAQVATLLISQDKDLTRAENQGLLATQPNPAAAAARLEAIRQLYATPQTWQNTPLGWNPPPGAGGPIAALAAVDAVFPHKEVASIQTFVVDPNAHVAFDATAGVLPLPSEFLMTSDYYATATGGKVQEVAAFGPAAGGLATLDGFSTTGMLLAPTTTSVVASTVTKNSVLLFELSGGTSGTWTRLQDLSTGATQPRYVTEPPNITLSVNGTAVAPLIGLQPGVPVGIDAQGNPVADPATAAAFVTLPPLKGGTKYAVAVTNDVKDTNGQPLTPGTIAKILNIALNPATPIVDQAGHSLLSGVSDANAQQLAALAPAVHAELATGLPNGQPALGPAIAAALGVADPTSKLAFAYTFRTQTLATTTTLAGIPTALDAACGAPCTQPVGPVTVTPAAQVGTIFAKYGIDADGTSPIKSTNIGAIVETKFLTFDLLDPTTGAFRADLPQLATNPAVGADIVANHRVAIDLLVVLPAAAVPTTVPVVIYHHGIGGPTRLDGSRAYALSVANSFTAQGMAVVAIDMAKHGDRAFCNVSAVAGSPDAECAPDSTCVPGTSGPTDPAGKGPGQCRLKSDTTQPGHFQNRPAFCLSPATCGAALSGNKGFPVASGEFFITTNFFRSRDTIRQDIIDHAQLMAVLPNLNAAIASTNVTLATPFHWAGQSLGAITGVLSGVANPQLTRIGLDAVGGTITDSLTNSPGFQASLDQLFLGLGIDRTVIRNPPAPGAPGFEAFEGQASAYLKALTLIKWILDPAEPLNYASTTGLAAKTLGQIAMCDDTFPNPFAAELYGNFPLATVPASPPFPVLTQAVPATAAVQWFIEPAATAAACPPGRTPHGFFVNWGFKGGDSSTLFLATPEADQAAIGALTTKAQAMMADFLKNGTAQATAVTPTSTP